MMKTILKKFQSILGFSKEPKTLPPLPEPVNEIIEPPPQEQNNEILHKLPEEFANEIKKHIKNPAQHAELIRKLEEIFEVLPQQLQNKNWVGPQNDQTTHRRSLSISTRAHLQDGGTCYAFSTTTVVRAALDRLQGFQTPSHKKLCGEIVKKFGKKGGCPEKVLGFLRDEYGYPIQWEVKEGVNETQEILKNQINQRPYIGAFRFCPKNWRSFRKIVSSKPVKAMTKSDFECKSHFCTSPDHYETGQECEPGGHGVVVERCIYQNSKKYWRIKNSWGEGSGDKGYFLIEPDAFQFERLIDVYYTLEHLKKPQHSKYYQNPKERTISGETYEYYETNWLVKSSSRNAYEAQKSGQKFVIEVVEKYELFNAFSKFWASVKPVGRHDTNLSAKSKIHVLFFKKTLDVFICQVEFLIYWAEKSINWIVFRVLKKGETLAWQSAKKAHTIFLQDKHENIVKFIASEEVDNKLYIVLKYYESGSIYQRIEYGRVFPLHTALAYLQGIAQGLAHIHSKSGFHGAIDADNLLIDNKTCRITDFCSMTFSDDRASEKVDTSNPKLQCFSILRKLLVFLLCPLAAFLWPHWQSWKNYVPYFFSLICYISLLVLFDKKFEKKFKEHRDNMKKKAQEFERKKKFGDKDDIYCLGKVVVAMMLGEGSQHSTNQEIASRFEADWMVTPLKNLCLSMLDDNPEKRPSAQRIVSEVSRSISEGDQIYRSYILSKLKGMTTSNYSETMGIIQRASSYLYSQVVDASLSV